MIETTETDAAFQKGMSCKEIVEFSERMERERDEARADATALAERLTALELSSTSELARLERERDEAGEALAAEIKHHTETTAKWNGHHMDLTMAQCDLNKALRERDEAREERDIALLEVEEISNDLKDSRKRIWQLEKQIEGLNNFANERYEEIQTVRKELDEAREQIEVCRGIIERTVIARNSALSDLTELERERDEAKAVIRFLWELAEIHLDLSEEELERVNRSWGASK